MQAHTSGGSHVPCALANRKIPNTRRGAVAAHAPGAPTLGRPPAPLAALAAPLQRHWLRRRQGCPTAGALAAPGPPPPVPPVCWWVAPGPWPSSAAWLLCPPPPPP